MTNTNRKRLRAWAEIDLAALKHNLEVARTYAGDREIMAVVKADAYGHGLAPIAEALADEVRWFGVANVNEGLEVTAHAPGKVFVLGPVLPHERRVAVGNRFVVSLSNLKEARAFNQIAEEMGTDVVAHAAVDTGMGRMGILESDLASFVETARSLTHLQLDGMATHFPSADEDAEFTRQQIDETHRLLEDAFPEARHRHLNNSAGLLDYSDAAPWATLMRPGLMLYGISPLPVHQPELRPVLSLKSRITLVRDLPAGRGISYGRTFLTEAPTSVATIGIGYGDGYPRHLSNNGAEVEIQGQRCPILGRVTMDQIVVDVSGLSTPPNPGDEVTLIGGSILATELAEKAGTISWEILTGITQRVKRVYLH